MQPSKVQDSSLSLKRLKSLHPTIHLQPYEFLCKEHLPGRRCTPIKACSRPTLYRLYSKLNIVCINMAAHTKFKKIYNDVKIILNLFNFERNSRFSYLFSSYRSVFTPQMISNWPPWQFRRKKELLTSRIQSKAVKDAECILPVHLCTKYVNMHHTVLKLLII